MTKASRRAALVAAALMVTLGGCGGDEDGPRGVLTEEDVDNVRVAQDTNDDLGRAVCEELNKAELEAKLFNNTLDNDRRFRLDDGDVVGSSAWAIPEKFETAQEALDSTIGEALAQCLAAPQRDGTAIEELTVGEGAYGYRSITAEGRGRGVFQQVLAPAGDHIVMVSVNHTGTGEPSADIRDLLRKALERADELAG